MSLVQVSDGPFDWDEEEQGVILGAFFYGYIVTQASLDEQNDSMSA